MSQRHIHQYNPSALLYLRRLEAATRAQTSRRYKLSEAEEVEELLQEACGFGSQEQKSLAEIFVDNCHGATRDRLKKVMGDARQQRIMMRRAG
jgi:hypothetical protein